jgi:hypothetical protein
MDSSIGIATGFRLDILGSILTRNNFSLFYSVQTGSAAHPASYPMSSGAYSQQPGREADNSPPSSIEVKNDGVIPPLPICLHSVILN